MYMVGGEGGVCIEGGWRGRSVCRRWEAKMVYM